MDLQHTIESVKQHVTQGDLEAALQTLVAWCDADTRCGDLGEAARISQAEYNRLKADVLRGTIAGEEARLTTNRITTRILQLVRRLETSQFELPEEVEGLPPLKKRRPAWRYYAIGGAAALVLALAGWWIYARFLSGAETGDLCPRFKSQYTTRVMILPFKRTGTDQAPEFDISDNLNSLFGRTPTMKNNVLADVNEGYDIDANYPNPAEAEDQATECDVQMIVWGRINNTGGQNRLNVFYRLLNANHLMTAGDTTISRLLHVTDQGSITRDDVDAIAAVSNLIYVVLANQLRADIPSGVLAMLQQPPAIAAKTDTLGGVRVDTLSSMVLADHFIKTGQRDQAMQELDALIDAYPTYSAARQKRAALLAAQGDYKGAARDLEVAVPQPEKASIELNEARTEAFLRSGQVEKAENELKVLDKKGSNVKWRNSKKQEVQDSTRAITARAQRYESLVAQSPANVTLSTRLAEQQLKLGNEKAAIKTAESARKKDPKNLDARAVLIEARLRAGDTTGAVRELRDAERAGLRVKGIVREMLPVTPLELRRDQ